MIAPAPLPEWLEPVRYIGKRLMVKSTWNSLTTLNPEGIFDRRIRELKCLNWRDSKVKGSRQVGAGISRQGLAGDRIF